VNTNADKRPSLASNIPQECDKPVQRAGGEEYIQHTGEAGGTAMHLIYGKGCPRTMGGLPGPVPSRDLTTSE